MKKLLTLIIIFTYQYNLAQESDSKLYIAPFKNDATGAYTIIHDDFGGHWADGIEKYADTMAYKKGIPFCFALIAGECDSADWKKAKEMIAHGHQVLNHSMHHKCGIEMDWCRANWNENDFNIEIDSSTSYIKTNTGKHPSFFMFPFDQHTDTMLSYLRSKSYSGARAGSSAVEEATIEDPFHLNFKSYPPEQTLSDLDSFANEAVYKKAWAIREVHGVNDGSWGVISLKEYEAHLNHLKLLSESNKIWVATLSDVLLYRLMKEKYTLSISGKDEQKRPIQISFFENLEELKSDQNIFKNVYASASNHNLTVVLNCKKGLVKKIIQNEKEIPYRQIKNNIYIEANPIKGSLNLSFK